MSPFLQPQPNPRPLGGKPLASQRDTGTALPMFKKTSGAKAGALLGRLKNLRSRDLAFIAAGLSMFIMAPIAEHFISQSGSEEPMQAGFDQKGSFFGAGAPFEDGVGGVAPGGLIGSDSDVVTPLNVRNPADLITNDEDGAAPPDMLPPVSQNESPAPRKPVEGGWKDAISDAAKRGVSKASERVKLPMPSAKLANKLNGISSFSGGSGHSGASLPNLAAPSSKGLTSVPHTGTNLSRVEAVAGYKGAGKRGNTGTGGLLARGADGRLTSPGGSSGSGSAEGYLQGAQVTASGPGFGRGSSGDIDKLAGASSAKDERNMTVKEKEDLALMRKKMEMQKAIELKWAKKQYDQIERKKMMEQTAMQTASQAALKVLDKVLNPNGSGQQQSGSGSPSGGSPSGGQQNQIGGGQRPETMGPGNTDNMQALSGEFGRGAGMSKDFPALQAAEAQLQQKYLEQANQETGGQKTLGEATQKHEELAGKVKEVETKGQTLKTKNDTTDGQVKTVEGMPEATQEQKDAKKQAAQAIPELPQDKTPPVDQTLQDEAKKKLEDAKKIRDEMEKNRPDTSGFLTQSQKVADQVGGNNRVMDHANALARRGNGLHGKALDDLKKGYDQGTQRNTELGEKRTQANQRLTTEQGRIDTINGRLRKLKG